MTKKRIFFLSVLVCWGVSAAAHGSGGGWSMNAGVNNPPGASLGLNFMYLWTNWAFEAGVGQIRQNTGKDSGGSDTSTTSVLGDLNFKYLFNSGVFRPYVELGAGSSTSVTTQSGGAASAGVGGTFGALGFFLIGDPIYAYVGIVSGGGNGSIQYGVGYSF